MERLVCVKAEEPELRLRLRVDAAKGMAAHTSGPSTWEAKASGSLWVCNLKRYIYVLKVPRAY